MVDAIKQEAQHLRELLRRELPRFEGRHREVEITSDMPEPVAALWGAVGWSSELERARILPPETAFGHERAEQRLAEYRGWGRGFSLTLDDLPSRFRLVDDDGQGVGFLVTDESRGDADPPVMAVIADTNKVVLEHPSYLGWVANEMVRRALTRWYCTMLRPSPPSVIKKHASSPFPTLSPATLQLSDDLWAIPSDTMSTVAGKPGGWFTMAHRRFEVLVDFLQTAEKLGKVELDDVLPGDVLRPNVQLRSIGRAKDKQDDLRELEGRRKGLRYKVGRVAGIPVIVASDDGFVELAVGPRDRVALDEIVAQRSWA